MKTRIALFILVWFMLPFLVNAQTTQLQKLSEYNTITIQGNIAMNYGHTDIVQNDLFYNSVHANMGIGLRVMKYLTPHFAIGVDTYTSHLHGYNDDYEYHTMLKYQIALHCQVQTRPSKTIDAFKDLQMYAYTGYGKIGFNSELINKKGVIPTETVVASSAQVIPIGVGIKYRIKEGTTASIEYVYTNVNSDYLDGFRNPLTEYDAYSKFQIGIATTIVHDYKVRPNLEW